MSKRHSRGDASGRRRRRGLAPLELVLALPVLLMIMALMINFGVIAAWKVRSLTITREAAWGTRWPRTVGNNPRPDYWPRSAGVNASGPTNVPEIDDPRVNLPVARGPLPRIDVDADLLDPTRGLYTGSSDIRRGYAMLATMGDYHLDSYARLLDDKWQYQRMGLPNNRNLRSWRLYNIEMPNVVARMQEAQVRVGTSYHQRAPNLYERLTPLDNDLHFLYLRGSSPNFYPRLRRACTVDREEVGRRVEDLITRIVGDPEREPPIDSLARRMRSAFRNLYRDAVQQYQDMPGGALVAAWAQANLAAVESYTPPQ
jgi:hypothetical protein